MERHNLKSPDKGVWAVLALVALGVLENVGGDKFAAPVGLAVMIIAGWAIFTVGRWLWLNHGSNSGLLR
jgi:hypothetical protein